METTLQGIQLLILLLLMIAVPVAMTIEKRHKIRVLRNEIAYWKHEVRKTLEALDATQRQAVLNYRRMSHPMANPPAGVMPTLQRLQQEQPQDTYALALGWEIVADQPEIVTVSLHGSSAVKSGHMLLTGETDSGKDTLAFLIAAQLCLRNRPDQLQVCWIDGKRADGAMWQGKAHNWREPTLGPDGIADAMHALQTERERREHLMVKAGVTRWEELPDGVRPPLLWIYVSELELLTMGTRDLEQWLKTELTAARASGMRYCIASQTVSGKSTTWRGQVGCYIAGCQSARSADEPNLGITSSEARDKGALPPSELPGSGYFTVRVKRDVATIRAPLVDLESRRAVLARLPAGVVVPAMAEPVRLVPSNGQRNGHHAETANGQRNGHHAEATNGTSASTMKSSAATSTQSSGNSSAAPVRDWTAAEREAVMTLLTTTERTNAQIVNEVFGIRGGRNYRPFVNRVVDMRSELKAVLTP